jgi:hypothetical protein
VTINFAVPIPEAAAGAVLDFSMGDLMKLQAELAGDDASMRANWIALVVLGLDSYSPETITACLRIGLKGADPQYAPFGLPLAALAERVADAIMLRVKGQTIAEMRAESAVATSKEGGAGETTPKP